ncbi:phospholipase D-like domain-containing protein [Clostridium butyricum]
MEDAIIENLNKSQQEICIAMAWLTSEKVIKVLEHLNHNNISIKIIIDNNEKNRKVRLWNPCTELKISDISTPYGKYKNLMHNKYCIIDKKIVIDGSYNWSNHAKYNLEHIIVIRDENVAKMYLDSFYKIYNNPRYFANYTISEDFI